MTDTGARLALLTDDHLEVLLTKAALRAAKHVLELSRPERGLKVSEVADRLSCAESTVYGLVDRGVLPAIRLGSAIRVLESALNDWIRSETQPDFASWASKRTRPVPDQLPGRPSNGRDRSTALRM